MNNKSMYKVLIFSLVFFSCGYRTVKLLDGRTKVPQSYVAYSNSRLNKKYLKGDIDTLSLYWRINENGTTMQTAYRFYGCGAFSQFVVLPDEINNDKSFDPEFTGYRGYFYEYLGCLAADIFVPINSSYEMGWITERFEIRGDTMKVFRDESENFSTYIKHPMPKNIAKYKATW